MTLPQSNRAPSKLWWVGHIIFGLVTGLVCYVIWKDENPIAAKKSLTQDCLL